MLVLESFFGAADLVIRFIESVESIGLLQESIALFAPRVGAIGICPVIALPRRIRSRPTLHSSFIEALLSCAESRP
jgi:hypothetical protein